MRIRKRQAAIMGALFSLLNRAIKEERNLILY